MNSTFGRGFSYGYRQTFNKKNSSTFFKHTFNNKSVFNVYNTSTNSQKVLINFSNKCFIDRAIFLDNNPSLVKTDILGSKTLSGEMKNGAESEKLENDAIKVGDGLSMLQGLFLVRHGIYSLIIDREVVEHLDPVANREVHDWGSAIKAE